jgi:lactoylglutathione lyase
MSHRRTKCGARRGITQAIGCVSVLRLLGYAAETMPTYLHTCYRIGDIDRSVNFYQRLGFEERRRMPIGDEAINVFMGLPGEDPVLELTYNHGVDSYDLGTGYNHIALGVEDLDGTLEGLAGDGIEPEKPPYRPGGRTEGPRIAFVRDPDGYRVELIERSG